MSTRSIVPNGAPFVTKVPEPTPAELQRDQALVEVERLKSIILSLESKVQSTDTVISGLKSQHAREMAATHSRQASDLAALRAQLPRSASGSRPAHLGPDPKPRLPTAAGSKPPTPRLSEGQLRRELELATAELRKKDDTIATQTAEIAQLKRDIQLLARKASLPSLPVGATAAATASASSSSPRTSATPRASASASQTPATPKSASQTPATADSTSQPSTQADVKKDDSATPAAVQAGRRSSLDGGVREDGEAAEARANELEMRREASLSSGRDASSVAAAPGSPLKHSPSGGSRRKTHSATRTPRRESTPAETSDEGRKTATKERSELLKQLDDPTEVRSSPAGAEDAASAAAAAAAAEDLEALEPRNVRKSLSEHSSAPPPDSARSVARSPSQTAAGGRRPPSARE